MSQENKEHSHQPDNQPSEIHLPLADLVKIRRAKVLNFHKQGVNVYPYRFHRSHAVKQILEKFDELLAQSAIISIAGRIMLKRKMGKSIFADVHDQSGKLQVYLKLDNVGEEHFQSRGDLIGVGSAKVYLDAVGIGSAHHSWQLQKPRKTLKASWGR